MSENMRQKRILAPTPAGFFHIAYTEWGDPENPNVLVCTHGHSRNSRDFDFLADAMSDRYRVVCPDMFGRGRSDWLPVKELYDYSLYVPVMASFLCTLGVDRLDYVGTSMGSVIGMSLAAMPGTPIRRFVVNDIGAVVSCRGIQRMSGYLLDDPLFETMAEAEAFFRRTLAPFGHLSDAHWQHITRHSVREVEGGWRVHYDVPMSLKLVASRDRDAVLWEVWDRMTVRPLLLRGSESDLLAAETASEMTRRGPGCELREIPGVGHAPALMDEAQIGIVRDWLLR
jgi:pimeloyl-ACP methyl ester carboxylesterase